MRVIKPAEIVGEILSLIDEADKELVVVSPYNDFTFGHELLARLKKARVRGINITFFLGNDVELPPAFCELPLQVYYVEKLHATIYLNEKQAVFTSMNLVEAVGNVSIDFGIATENAEEFKEVKETYLTSIQKNVFNNACEQDVSFKKELFENRPVSTLSHDHDMTVTLPEKMQLFETRFQKIFRRHNLKYHQEKEMISCNNFPFAWTSFEYTGTIKISFHLASTFDYRTFRKENINDFNDWFGNHKGCWNYPYDSLCIYGDENAHGIQADDLKARVAYTLYLIKEVTKFLQPKEEVLSKTPLFTTTHYSVY